METGESQVIDDDKMKADIFNKFLNCSDELPLKTEGRQIENVYFDLTDVESRLKQLNVNKSAGVDEIHPRVLHELSSVLAYPLMKIFETSF